MPVSNLLPEYEVLRDPERCIRCRVCERQCANEVHYYDPELDKMFSDDDQCVDCMGVLILGVFLANGSETTGTVAIPLWMMVMCSLVMAIGTSIGGYKIIKAVGMDMVKLEGYQGFSADLAASFCLLLSSLFGLPVSTTHTKTTAIMGVGATKRLSAVNFSVVKEMVLTWVLTFPGCGLIGYGMYLPVPGTSKKVPS